MTSLLTRFLSEARDLVEQASRGLLKLEEDPEDRNILNDVFRALHTIKGSSGVVDGMTALTRLVHAGEDVLDACRTGELRFTADIADLIFLSLDTVSEWLGIVEDSGKLPDGAEGHAADVVARLRASLPDLPDANAEAERIKPPKEMPLNWLDSFPGDLRLDAFRRATMGEVILGTVYSPDPGCFFTGDDPLLTAQTMPDLLSQAIRVRTPWGPIDELDPFRCNIEIGLFGGSDPEVLERHFQYVADQVSTFAIPLEALPFLEGVPLGDTEAGRVAAAVRISLASLDPPAVAELAENSASKVPADSREASLWTWLGAMARGGCDEGLAERLITAFEHGEQSNAAPKSSSNPTPSPGQSTAVEALTDIRSTAVEILKAQQEALSIPATPEEVATQLPARKLVLARAFAFLGYQDALETLNGLVGPARRVEDADKLLHLVETVIEQIEVSATGGAAGPRSLRGAVGLEAPNGQSTRDGPKVRLREIKVDQTRIDALMNLAGELVVAKNALPFLARRAEQEFGVRELARDIKMKHQSLNRIVEDLQAAIMQVRMVPVSVVFSSFPRLVRDISRKLKKNIRLVVEGEDTEADKNVVEDLADPLVHLVRNCLDHGIEAPEERVAAGKSAEGTLFLSASQEEDRVIIEIRDDGRGIDPEKIRRKALEKGSIDAARSADLSDAEALKLIFLPGFSTSEKVSDVSGRGVGMDVVRVAVDRAGGTVEVFSELGKGTTVRMSLPLAMSLSRVMMVEVGGQPFGIPMEHVAETVRVPRHSIHCIKDRETFLLRGRLIPLLRSRGVLGIRRPTPVATSTEEEAVLVINFRGRVVGFVVDDFGENAEVIVKPLEGILSNCPHFSGTALLGDGRILLIINMSEVLQCL